MNVHTEPITAVLAKTKRKISECEKRITEYEQYAQTEEIRQLLAGFHRDWEFFFDKAAALEREMAEMQRQE